MKAEIIINKNYKIGNIDKRIYGSFIEHLGRAVYDGIYEPTHPTADDMGFRKDVLELINKLNVPIVRYPGGNFVSGYNWEDGTGDKSKRPTKIEQAWEAIETNQMGIDEFQEWAKRANTEVMMAVNLGTRGPADARNCVEYCNATSDTYYANMRRQNGFDKPFNVKTWCIGNEMDGPWQICHKTADDYGKLANEAAKMMKWVDPSIECVVCGSSNYNMPTFGEWELTVLNHAYDNVDYVSLHQYYDHNCSTEEFLGRSEHMDRFIKGVVAICDTMKAIKKSEKDINLSFDEWNVWYHSNGETYEKFKLAEHRLEDIYNFEDAILVGEMLMTLQNNCDRVKMACQAQLVNVIAPIITETGGKAWAQTIFYPYMLASQNGRGETLRAVVNCDEYNTEGITHIPYLTTSVINNEEKREITIFAVNRSLTEDMDVDLLLEHFGKVTPVSHTEIYNEDLYAVNSASEQNVIPIEKPLDSIEKVTLKKHSWNMLKFKY